MTTIERRVDRLEAHAARVVAEVPASEADIAEAFQICLAYTEKHYPDEYRPDLTLEELAEIIERRWGKY